MSQPNTVAGAGLAELPIPFWLRVARAGLVLGVFGLIFSSIFVLAGWRWVTDAGADGFTTGFAVACAALMTFAIGIPFGLARAGFFNAIVGIRRGSGGHAVFGGHRSIARPIVILTLLGLVFGLTCLLGYEGVRSCPLPELLSKVHLDVTAPSAADKMVPVYFWDYATQIDPQMLDRINIVVPYEKGPPQKLLPKIFFEDSSNHSIVLELHGRRPRSYPPTEVLDLFNSQTAVVQPRDWPLLWRLEREAGLTAQGLHAPILYLLRLNQGTRSQVTQAIGVPWDTSTAAVRPENGRLFFWGPDGSVFQVKCPSPCILARTLELIQFPPDPRGSHAERLEWTRATLKHLLEAAENGAKPEAGPERARQDNLLSLYLVSLLTLDPKDPEAFFHVGKLARNRETILSAIRYGRDLGLEHAKIVELEAVADRLSL